jgi:stage III sporulation protein AG
MNTEELKNLISKLKADKKLFFVLILGFTGMLLVMLSGGDKKEIRGSPVENEHYVISETELAVQVEKFISNIKNAGKSKVILTFESYEETVYAVNSDEKADASGNIDRNSEYVIIDSGNAESGLEVKLISPKIRGVSVLCEGGENPVVKEQIVTAISVLFDISSNKVSVAEMAD